MSAITCTVCSLKVLQRVILKPSLLEAVISVLGLSLPSGDAGWRRMHGVEEGLACRESLEGLQPGRYV